MPTLETKIPPPLVALALASGMWFFAPETPAVALPQAARIVAAAILAILGAGLGIAGSASFRNAKTTVNPMKPEKVTTLVATGVYRVTRNPMYLGMLLGLIAVAVYLFSLWALVGPAVFFAYINRFQIDPEESALETKFGASYTEYKHAVRRWL